MNNLKKWQLLTKEDVSLSKWFPVEKRTYRLPSGSTVDNFYVSTFADVAMVVPVLDDGRVVLIKMFKQGADDLIIQFPAGRKESTHVTMEDAAASELREETGILVDHHQLELIGKFSTMSTKSTEMVYLYYVDQTTINSTQKFDDNEEIEVILKTPAEIDEMIVSGEIYCFQTIAAWHMAKLKHSEW